MALRFLPETGDHRAMDGWFTPGRLMLILLVFAIPTFAGVLFGTQTFVYRDFGFVTYPFAKVVRDSWLSGQAPLWNPDSLCGIPFLAQWNTQALYPPALLYILLPLPWSLNVFCIGHLLLGGLGMYFLARRWTGNPFAAALAGTAFAYSGLAMSFLTWVHTASGFGLMPWVVLTVERGWREGGRMIVAGALIGALQMLTGAPEIIFQTWAFLALLAATQAWCHLRPSFALRFVSMVALVTGLTAIQMLPFFDLLAHAQRGSGYGGSEWSVPLWGWANLLLPLYHTYRWPGDVFHQTGQFWIASYYFGVGILALATLAIISNRRAISAPSSSTPSDRQEGELGKGAPSPVPWSGRQKRIWLLAAVAAVSFIMAFGDAGGLFKLMRTTIPQLGFMRFPVKFVALTVFIAPILAAFAVARISEAISHRGAKRQLLIIGLVMVAAIAVLRWQGFDPRVQPDLPRVGTINAAGRAALAIVFLFLIAALITATGRARFGIQLALLIVIWVDLLTQAPQINPKVNSSVFDPGLVSLNPRPEFGRSRVMTLPKANDAFNARMLPSPADDFIGKRAGLFANCNLLEGYAKVDGFYSLAPREFQQTHSTIFSRIEDYSAPLADFLGVQYINSATNYLSWEARTNFMPLVTAGQRPVFANRDEILQGMQKPDFSPRTMVYFPPELKPKITVTEGSASAQVTSGKYSAHQIDLEVTATTNSLVVIAQTYYHWWRAFEGEREIPILRANHSFQALEVSAGHHQFKLVYLDNSFRLGSMISLLSVVVCGLVWRRERIRE